MKKIRINIDFDDVLSDFCEHWMDYHYYQTGERIVPTSWNVKLQSKYGSSIYDYFREPNFYVDVPMKHGADRLISFITDHSHIFSYKIVSSCKQEEPYFSYIKEQKQRWLMEKFGGEVSDHFILTSKSKKGYPADIVIDDYHINLIESNKNSLRILFSAPHNTSIDLFDIGGTCIRVHEHKEILEILKEISLIGFQDYCDNVK